MLDSVLAALPNVVAPVFANQRDVVPKHERNLGGAAFYQVYQTRDDRYVVLAGQEEKFVRNVLEAFGRPDLFELCARGPGPHQRPVIDFLRQEFRTRDRDEWVSYFQSVDACFAPVHTVKEAFEDRHVLVRRMIMRDELGRAHIGSAIKFVNEPSVPVLREPACGANNPHEGSVRVKPVVPQDEGRIE